MKKKLQTNDTIESWVYDTGIEKGISVGVYDNMCGSAKAVVYVESFDSADGIVNRIVINKKKADKYGFRVIIEDEYE